MDGLFIAKLLLSFLVGGSFVAFTVWLSEKYGSKLGGLFIGLPSTSLMGLFFIAWTQGDAAAVSAVPIMPAVAGVNSIFVALFVLLHRHGWKKALAAAFVFWLAANLLLVFLPLDSLALSLVLAAVLYTISASYLCRFPHRRVPAPRSSTGEFLFRSVFAGTVVAAAVLLAKMNGPLWGGVLSNFPAAFTSVLILISNKHGRDFTASIGRTMAIASIAAVSFTVAFYFLVLPLGLALGLALSLLVSILAGFAIYRLAL
jgi:uncharacterized membrane protein (GlpM family)